MKYLMLITVLALTANVYAGPKSKKGKKAMHDKEHQHVKKKSQMDHDHDEAHHKKHDHLKHHPNHEADMKNEAAPVTEEVKQ